MGGGRNENPRNKGKRGKPKKEEKKWICKAVKEIKNDFFLLIEEVIPFSQELQMLHKLKPRFANKKADLSIPPPSP